MLNMIKDLIRKQKAMQEAADLLLEADELDDSIVLDEDVADPPIEEPEEPEIDEEGDDTVPGGDDLPTPVGAQTGEPIVDDTSDLLDITLDLGTNTQTDTLPVPPRDASSAVDGDSLTPNTSTDHDDLLDSPIDGPGTPPASEPAPHNDDDDIMNMSLGDDDEGEPPHHEEESDDLMDMPLDGDDDDTGPAEESADYDLFDEPLSEAISVGDTGSDQQQAAGDDAAADAPADAAPDTQPADSVVTNAVKDKVDEINSEEEPLDTETDTASGAAGDDADLLKKLGNLTTTLNKNIEDIKKKVIDRINK